MRVEAKGPSVVILAGGQGSRLAALFPGHPKALVRFQGESFLRRLLTRLRQEGAGAFYLALGAHAEKIVEHLRELHLPDVFFRHEIRPRGTAGATADIVSHFRIRDPFLVCNADTWWESSLADFFREPPGGDAAAKVAMVRSFGENRYATLALGAASNGIEFGTVGDYCYAGLAWVRPSLFERTPTSGIVGLEKDILWGKRMSGHLLQGRFYDFGTARGHDELVRYFEKSHSLRGGCRPARNS